jgi:hypothetical protein
MCSYTSNIYILQLIEITIQQKYSQKLRTHYEKPDQIVTDLVRKEYGKIKNMETSSVGISRGPHTKPNFIDFRRPWLAHFEKQSNSSIKKT